MSFSRIYSAQTHLLRGQIITVEVDISKGLNSFSVVGLPDKAIDEARDRVGSALKNTGFESPKHKNQKTIVSLSPADIKKEGSFFDLSIALAYLLSSGDIKFNPEGRLFLGELSLNGDLKSIKGALPLAEEAKRAGFREIYLPFENAKEAALVEGIDVYGIKNIKEVVFHLNERSLKSPDFVPLEPVPKTEIIQNIAKAPFDIRDIRGQENAKRGLEIAAAGGHNIALYGPPGTGKTMLARAFVSLLPEMSSEEILEITSIHSIAGMLKDGLVVEPPFRSPHHTASYVSIIGGGQNLKPGEVTLAHGGVLFLDEFPEFDKRVVESLRQPLEDNVVTISRAKGTASFPSNFILIAAMNMCPCGNTGSKQKSCTCTASDLQRYKRKLSGPIVDRIDMWVPVGAIDYQTLGATDMEGETTESVRKRVTEARNSQEKRFKTSGRTVRKNSDMNAKDISEHITLSKETKDILIASAEKLKLSARAYHRVLKLARTIADLEGNENIQTSHILEALQYRPRVEN